MSEVEEVHLPAMDASILNKIAFGKNAGKAVKKIKSFSVYNWDDKGEKEIIGDFTHFFAITKAFYQQKATK